VKLLQGFEGLNFIQFKNHKCSEARFCKATKKFNTELLVQVVRLFPKLVQFAIASIPSFDAYFNFERILADSKLHATYHKQLNRKNSFLFDLLVGSC
jgi:hypothetical protein